jgi:hypothetical protein
MALMRAPRHAVIAVMALARIRRRWRSDLQLGMPLLWLVNGATPERVGATRF